MIKPYISVDVVAFDSVSAQAMMSCALDELDRRYGPGADRIAFDPVTFTPPNGAFLVARQDGHLAGGVGLRRVAPDMSEIKRLWVRPDLRRSGLGQMLMDAAEEEARRLGHTMIVLETGSRQPEAIAFYGALGWTKVPELPVKVSDHEGAFAFIKQLGSSGSDQGG